jgi:uridine kinase
MSFDRLAEILAIEVRLRLETRGLVVVALDGFGCCGKSTLAQALSARTESVILETDDFQQPDGGEPEQDSPLRYRRWAALQAAAAALAQGRPARYAPIDWDAHQLAPEVTVEPRPVLIIDGIGSHALDLPTAPLKIFVDGRAESRMWRVAARDGAQYANWDRYVAIEYDYFAWHQPWRTADLVVLGAELDFTNSSEGFARQIEALSASSSQRPASQRAFQRLDAPWTGDARPRRAP